MAVSHDVRKVNASYFTAGSGTVFARTVVAGVSEEKKRRKKLGEYDSRRGGGGK